MRTRPGIARLTRLIATSALAGGVLSYAAANLRPIDPGPGAIMPGSCPCYVFCAVPRSSSRTVEYRGVSYRGARLAGSLRGRTFVGCDFAGADLRGLDLRDCRFWNCDLRAAHLDRAQLRGARDNEGTRWPARFHAAARGVARVAYTDLPVPVSTLTAAALPKH